MDNDFFSVNGSDCGFSNGVSRCRVEVGRIGKMDLHSRLNPCTSPEELAITLSMERFGEWELNFLSGNPEESRQVGPSFWPLWLRVRLNSLQDSSKHSLKACVESAKNGHRLCFLDEAVQFPPCSSSSRSQNSLAAISVLSAIFLALSLALFLVLIFWYHRTRRWKRYRRQVNGSSSSSSNSANDSISIATPPLLPGAAMCDSVKEQRAQRESLLRPPAAGEFWTDLIDGETSLPVAVKGGGNRKEFLHLYSPSYRESKLIQTSLSVLDATALLHNTSPSDSGQPTGMPSSTVSPLQEGDQEKPLLYGSEQSESPV